MAGRRKRRALKAEINVVPYIDVTLVLLIIFMITAPMLNLGVDIELPKSDARALDIDSEPVLITIDQQGTVQQRTRLMAAVLAGALVAGLAVVLAAVTDGLAARKRRE